MKSSNKIRNEYNKMVKQINSDLKKLAKIDPESQVLEQYRGYFKTVKIDNPNYNTIAKMKKQASDLLKSGRLSLQGHERAKANAINTLHNEGYTFINKRNFNSFMRFLDDARARGLGSLYSSTQLLTAINEAKEKGLSNADIKKNIQKWSDQMKRDKEGRIVEVKRPKKLKVEK